MPISGPEMSGNSQEMKMKWWETIQSNINVANIIIANGAYIDPRRGRKRKVIIVLAWGIANNFTCGVQ